MKLSVRILALLVFIIVIQTCLTDSLKREFDFANEFKEKNRKIKQVANNSVKKNDFAREFRFSSNQNKLMDEQLNVFIKNTEILIDKPASNKNDAEQELFPSNANSGTYYSWGFAWWTYLSFPPTNAIHGRSFSYWLSKNDVNTDFIEFFFERTTKVDSLLIDWRLPPTSFKVEFRVKDNGALIPVTERFYKYKPISIDGHQKAISSADPKNALVFEKPIFVKSIRITMWDPLKSHKFSINKVRFWNIKTTMMVINESVDPCKQICWYVNTSKPVEGTQVEGMDCLSGMSTADNRELFQYWGDRTVRTYNDHFCVGFDIQNNDVILKECKTSSPFQLLINTDNTMSFKGYENMCIGLDNSKTISDNFVTEKTDLTVSSEYDRSLFKKENILSKIF